MPDIELSRREYRPNSHYRGEALDFGQPTTTKKRHEANPIIWGAWGGLFGGTVGTIASIAGQLSHSQTAMGFAGGGFFWLWVVANIKNWFAARKP